VLLTGIAPAHEEIRPGQDVLCDLGPVGLPNNTLREETCVTA